MMQNNTFTKIPKWDFDRQIKFILQNMQQHKFSQFLSRFSILTRDIEIANLSVCPSARP